jgi:hypothetical protein
MRRGDRQVIRPDWRSAEQDYFARTAPRGDPGLSSASA